MLIVAQGGAWDAIPEELLTDCVQLVKANSIEGLRSAICIVEILHCQQATRKTTSTSYTRRGRISRRPAPWTSGKSRTTTQRWFAVSNHSNSDVVRHAHLHTQATHRSGQACDGGDAHQCNRQPPRQDQGPTASRIAPHHRSASFAIRLRSSPTSPLSKMPASRRTAQSRGTTCHQHTIATSA